MKPNYGHRISGRNNNKMQQHLDSEAIRIAELARAINEEDAADLKRRLDAATEALRPARVAAGEKFG